MPTIVYFLIGVFIGMVSMVIFMTPKPSGKFLIDKNNEQKDIYRLDFEIPMEEISEHQYITLKVVTDSNLSQ